MAMLINKTIKAHATKSVFIYIFEKKVPHKAKKSLFAYVFCSRELSYECRAQEKSLANHSKLKP